MLHRAYGWILGHAQKPYAIWILIGISFAESSFLPIVPDVIMVPMILGARRRAFWLATVTTISSVAGGYLGYLIGYFAFEAVGLPLVHYFSSVESFEKAKAAFAQWGFWLIILKGMTPIPYKIVTILCGVMHYDLVRFTIASAIARGMRFYVLAGLLYFFGDRAAVLIERRLGLVVLGVVLVVIAVVVGLKLL